MRTLPIVLAIFVFVACGRPQPAKQHAQYSADSADVEIEVTQTPEPAGKIRVSVNKPKETIEDAQIDGENLVVGTEVSLPEVTPPPVVTAAAAGCGAESHGAVTETIPMYKASKASVGQTCSKLVVYAKAECKNGEWVPLKSNESLFSKCVEPYVFKPKATSFGDRQCVPESQKTVGNSVEYSLNCDMGQRTASIGMTWNAHADLTFGTVLPKKEQIEYVRVLQFSGDDEATLYAGEFFPSLHHCNTANPIANCSVSYDILNREERGKIWLSLKVKDTVGAYIGGWVKLKVRYRLY